MRQCASFSLQHSRAKLVFLLLKLFWCFALLVFSDVAAAALAGRIQRVAGEFRLCTRTSRLTENAKSVQEWRLEIL